MKYDGVPVSCLICEQRLLAKSETFNNIRDGCWHCGVCKNHTGTERMIGTGTYVKMGSAESANLENFFQRIPTCVITIAQHHR